MDARKMEIFGINFNEFEMVKGSLGTGRGQTSPQVGKSACIVLAKERHSKGERVPFSALS